MTVYRVFQIDGGRPADEIELGQDTSPTAASSDAASLAARASDPGCAFVVRTTDGSLLQLFSRYCRAKDYRTTCNGAHAVAVVSEAPFGVTRDVCLYHLRKLAEHDIEERRRDLSLNPPEVDEFDDAMRAAVDSLIDEHAPDSIPEEAVEAEADTIAQSFGMPLDLTTHRLIEAIERRHVAVIG